MSDASAVLDDLRAESAELDLIVGGPSPAVWASATPAPRWTVAHQIAHLAWTDRAALLSVTDPEAFRAEAERAAADPGGFVDRGADEGARLAPDVLLAGWREGRDRLQEALRSAPPGGRHPWYGPPMSVASMATGRLMETWAHGQDIADALGIVREPTTRLRHVARIGVRARDYAFLVRGIEAPTEEFRVELIGPTGELTTYGPEGAGQRVTGPLYDFCLLVTQRAHRDDLAVRATGADADRWLDIAQAFAGPAGPGRPRRADR
ncbi:TIGR03084 family metal-binding protein [Streptomyces sp. AM 4-1-1]|uniref:TIGR03084 family metal-binding protein n=1 Tax=Streptomyces sp. AM 4-1-1 TaxID=3028710 RepID=UPI0023B95B18|nr:TIGR03084 family metal-binding protein [Streptomyces sp. AM 4-1-1]WEH35242.1 TIGR03084 family metal-binding protein [Streptomyces sp. AM 4-1-1]